MFQSDPSFPFSLELIEGRNLLASAAADGSVRLWTVDGHYIGTSLTLHTPSHPHILYNPRDHIFTKL